LVDSLIVASASPWMASGVVVQNGEVREKTTLQTLSLTIKERRL